MTADTHPSYGNAAQQRRVGLLIPSSNTVMEVDFCRRLPPPATVHTGRMFLEHTTPEAEAEMLDHHALPAARAVGTARPDAIVFGCTSAGALRGAQADRDMCRAMQQDTGAPVISVITAVLDAIKGHAARQVAILTPYTDTLNARIRESVEDSCDAEVVAIHGLGITDNFAIADVTPEDITRFAADALGGASFDLLFVSCTNFRAMDAIPALAGRFAVPVVTSNQAALAAVIERLGLSPEADSRRFPAASRR